MKEVCIRVEEVMIRQKEAFAMQKQIQSQGKMKKDKPMDLQKYFSLKDMDASLSAHLVQEKDVIHSENGQYRVDHVCSQRIEKGKWIVEFLEKKTFRTFNQSIEGGRILRETHVSLHSFQYLMDAQKEKDPYQSCQIWYVDRKHPVKYFGKDVYPEKKVTFSFSVHKNWKYRLNENWNAYREKHQLSDACISKLVFD
ncbi:MAG: hypothetical protein KBT48_02705 [Firmicutes bacterium]|nr:hypothetical protein [Bacillota bacterium]